MTDDRPQKFRHVDATFGRQVVRFELPMEPVRLKSLELAIGPAYAALKRFENGRWTVTDLRQVLAHAYPDVPDYLLQGSLTEVPEVDAVLQTNPLGTYAPLAFRVLEALIFGLDLALASFDEPL